MSTQDQDLVTQALEGRLEAFGTLVQRYSGLVHALILERVRRRDEVEDLVQQTFLTAFQSLTDLRRPSRFAPWLAQIARTTALHWVRHESGRAQAEQGSGGCLPSPLAAPDAVVESEERLQALWQVLDELPESARQVVVLYHLEGCSYREVGRFLGLSLATVRWRLLRAERQLSRQVVQLLGEGARLRAADRQRLCRRIVAGLAAGAALAPRAEALLLSTGAAHSLVALCAPVVAGLGVVGTVVLLRTGYLQPSSGGQAAMSGPAPASAQRIRVQLGSAAGPADSDGGPWSLPPAPPSAASLAADTAGPTALPAADDAPPASTLAPDDPLPADPKPATPVAEPQRQRPPAAVTLTVVKYAGMDPRLDGFPDAIPTLVAFVGRQPGPGLEVVWRTLSLDRPEVRQSTLLYMTGMWSQMQLRDTEKRGLGEYLKAGGLLFADDKRQTMPRTPGMARRDAGQPNTPFDRQLKGLLRDPLVLGDLGGAWQKVPATHALYSCFYDLGGAPPRQGAPDDVVTDLEMLQVRGRVAVILSDLNISSYWGGHYFAPGFPREAGLRFGTNLLVYAMVQQGTR